MSDDETRVLTTEYGVVKSVLGNLPMRRLNKAAQVCSAWSEAVKIIKRSRSQIYTLANQESLDVSDVETVLAELMSEPRLCLLFLTSECSDFRKFRHSGMRPEFPLLKLLQYSLPRSCCVLGGVTPGLVIGGDARTETAELESGEAFGMFLLPEISGVKVKQFYLDRNKMKDIDMPAVSCDQREVTGRILDLDNSDDIQCLILTGNSPQRGSECMETLCDYAIHLQPKVAIGGGFLDSVIHPSIALHNLDKNKPATMGIAFCGSRVLASSMVIPQNVTSSSETEKIIIRFRQNHKPARRSIAFMFACVARGVHMYGQSGVESGLFRKHFPSTPILGFFGSGEIGVNSHDQEASTGEGGSSPKKRRQTYLHSYSTTFVIISFLE